MKPKLLVLILAALLTAFTVFIALDTFVIPRGYQVEVDAEDMFAKIKAATEEAGTPEGNVAQEEAGTPEGNVAQEEAGKQENIRAKEDTGDAGNINQTETISENGRQEDTGDSVDESAGTKAASMVSESFLIKNSAASVRLYSDDTSGTTGGSPSGRGNTSDDDTTRGNSSGRNTWDSRSGEDVASDDATTWGNSSGDRSTWSNRSGRGSTWSRSYGDESTEELSITDQLTDEYTYSDDNITISISLYEVNETYAYVADVQLSSAVYLKTAFADNSYGRNFTETTSDIASENNAILAINGDYYGARERGYVIRNGVVYRDSISDSDVLCIYVDGSMEIIDPSQVTTQELVGKGVWQAFSFGPALLEDGEVADISYSEADSYMVENPRTAIGVIEPLHYIFVVTDGRTSYSDGLSLQVLAEFMQSLGVTTAYNLDGGGSSTMVFQGNVINDPSSWGNNLSEREVSDIVYIG